MSSRLLCTFATATLVFHQDAYLRLDCSVSRGFDFAVAGTINMFMASIGHVHVYNTLTIYIYIYIYRLLTKMDKKR